MKYALFSLLLFATSLTGQTPIDSAAVVKEVDSLIQVSRMLTGQGDFDKALDVNAAAEKIALEKLGRESAAYGSCCFNRGRLNYFNGNYQDAEKWYFESIAIRERVIGKEHPDYAWSLNNLANLYLLMGKHEKAEPLYLESKAIREKVLGKEHLDFAGSLNNLANLYRNMGDYEKAELLCLESRAILEKVLGKEHPNFAGSLYNLASLYHLMGNYEKAEPLFLEGKVILEKVLDKEHPDFAGCLQNLANLYSDMGDYKKGEPLYLESKAIREKVLGKEHPDFAISLDNLANLYSEMGNYEKAEPLYLESKAILEIVLGKEHPYFAQSLNNLATVYRDIGNYEKAEPLYLESKAIWEKVLGKEHPDFAISLNNLADLYRLIGNYEKAEPPCLEAKAIREKVLGKEHPDFAISLNNLAILYHFMGNFEKAEPFCLEARAIREKVLGKEHPHFAISLHNLADLYETQKRFSESEPLQEELAGLNQSRLAQSATFLSVRELASYAAAFQSKSHTLFAQALARPVVQLGKMPSLGYDQALFFKGFLLQTAARLNTLAASNPESEEINLRLKGYRRRLAAQYAEPITERKGVAELEEKAAAAEKELARSVAGYAEAARQVNWQEVQSALKTGESAIEFVHFPKKTDSIMYAALLLLPGTEQPKFIPLFEEKSLDSLLRTSGERKADYVNGLYSLAGRGVVALGKPQKTLFEMLWQPLEKELAGVKTVFFSPTGLLHRVNLGAIPITDEETLADRFHLVELCSTRQLVVPPAVKISNSEALLFGGIQYEMDSMGIAAANLGLENSDLASRGALNFSQSDSTLRLAYQPRHKNKGKLFGRSRGKSRGGAWSFLKWTEKEVAALEPILTAGGLKPTARKGIAATEESFKTIGKSTPSPRVLHLATHGFFFPDVRGERREARQGAVEPVFKISEHPMIRSGLILAGGNYAWKTGKPLRPGMEDGILTAYEISQMNLAATELVVLSACETGLGDIQGNEGVYGLQRAFKIAGAKYLVMSLWQVPDRETAEFMTVFYKKWLEGKMPIPDAFRATQKEMRVRFINPYSWAGFVLVE